MISFVQFVSHKRLIHSSYTDDETRKVYKGTAQGGVLSPLLYLLYVSNIADKLNKNVVVSQFADDIALYGKSKTVNRRKNLLTNAIAKVDNNVISLGLELSLSKTQILHFNNLKVLPGKIEILVKGHVITSSEAVRFLGLIHNSKMTVIPHIDAVIKKYCRALNIVKYLCSTWLGSNLETLINLYNDYVRFIIDFGSNLYFPKSKKGRKKIDSIQNNAIRIALGHLEHSCKHTFR